MKRIWIFLFVVLLMMPLWWTVSPAQEKNPKPEYAVYALKQGEVQSNYSFVILFGPDVLTPFTVSSMFYLKGPHGEHIVVDTGQPAPEQMDPNTGIGRMAGRDNVKGGGEASSRALLAKVGITPDDVNILILTHLHPDHVGTASLFKKAKVYIGKREWDAAMNPGQFWYPLFHYAPIYESCLKPLKALDVVLVDDEPTLLPGLKLIQVPGHSPGHMAVVVDTQKGTAVVAGDAWSGPPMPKGNPGVPSVVDKNFQRIPLTFTWAGVDWLPSGNSYNSEAEHNSKLRILSIASNPALIWNAHNPMLYPKGTDVVELTK